MQRIQNTFKSTDRCQSYHLQSIDEEVIIHGPERKFNGGDVNKNNISETVIICIDNWQRRLISKSSLFTLFFCSAELFNAHLPPYLIQETKEKILFLVCDFKMLLSSILYLCYFIFEFFALNKYFIEEIRFI